MAATAAPTPTPASCAANRGRSCRTHPHSRRLCRKHGYRPLHLDLSLYEPVASAGTKSVGKAVMLVLAALAGLLVIGFGVVTFAAVIPDTVRGFFD